MLGQKGFAAAARSLAWLLVFGVGSQACQDQANEAKPDAPLSSATAKPAVGAPSSTASAAAKAAPSNSADARKSPEATASQTPPNDQAPAASVATIPTEASGKPADPKPANPKPANAKPARAKRRSKGFKLIDEGAAPRRQLRLKVKAGHTEQLRMSTKVVMTVSVGEQSLPPSQLPEMMMDIVLKATDVKANGDIRYTYTLTNGELKGADAFPPQAVTALRDSLKKLVGLNGYSIIDERGIQKSSKLNIPRGLPPQVQQMMGGIEQGMDRIVVPFPKKAVGVGARWRQRRTIRQAGIRLRQSTRYELKEMKGDRVVCQIDIKQKAKPQSVTAPTGATVQLLRLRSLGSGKATLLLDRLAPQHSVIATSTDVKMGLPNQKKSMSTNTQLTVVLSGVKRANASGRQ